MKASIHSAREGTARHNDREFNVLNSTHIDPTRVKDNIYMSYKNLPFVEAEKEYYRDHYSNWIKKQNKRYKAAGNHDKVRTINDLLKRHRTRPEEMILQIGDRKETVEPEVFEACVRDFLKEMAAYSSNYHIINVAIHNDETTPHCHIRGVWDYTDKDGNLHISQTKALEALGFEAPDQGLPGQSRYNNPKISFQNTIREKWYDICEARGVKLDREPDKSNYEHQKINQLIIQRQELEIEENDKKIADQRDVMERQEQLIRIMREQIIEAEEELKKNQAEKKARELRAMEAFSDLFVAGDIAGTEQNIQR